MRKRRDVSSFGQVRKDFKTVSDQLNSVGDDLRKANPFRDQAKPKKKTRKSVQEPPSFKTLWPVLFWFLVSGLIVAIGFSWATRHGPQYRQALETASTQGPP